MKSFRLSYNPYTVETKLYECTDGGEIAVDENSPMAVILWEHMGKWLSAWGSWRGFFAELAQSCGDAKLEIGFEGAQEDFDALSEAARLAEQDDRIKAELHYISGAHSELQEENQIKLEKISSLLEYAESPGRWDHVTAAVTKAIKKAWDPYFEVNIAGADSKAKAWLQNALIGRRVLPEEDVNGTAAATRIDVNNSREEFAVSSISRGGTLWRYTVPGNTSTPSGSVIVEHVYELVGNLLRQQETQNHRESAGMDAARLTQREPAGANAVELIQMEGPAPDFADCKMKLAFRDWHREQAVTAEVLKKGALTVLVLDGGALSNEETLRLLRELAGMIRTGRAVNRNRFVIACVCGSAGTEDGKKTGDTLRRILRELGIDEAGLFLVGEDMPEGISGLRRAILEYENRHGIPMAVQQFYRRMLEQIRQEEQELGAMPETPEREEQRSWLKNFRQGLDTLIEI